MKQKLIKNTLIIFSIYIVLRLIGFLSIYFINSHLLNGASYTRIMTLFILVLDLSSFGLFPFFSRNASMGKGEALYNQKKRILLYLGLSFFFMYMIVVILFKIPFVALYLSPCFLISPFIFSLRGLLQGSLHPYKVVISIGIEILTRVFFIIILVNSVVLKRENLILIMAFISIFLGEAASLIYLKYTARTRGKGYYNDSISSAIFILPITIFISIFSAIDSFSFNFLDIPDSIYQVFEFRDLKIIELPIFLAGVFSSLWYPLLLKRVVKDMHVLISISILSVFFALYNVSPRLYTYLYKGSFMQESLRLMVPLIIPLAFIKGHMALLIERRKPYFVLMTFIIAYIVKLILNIALNDFRCYGIVISSYVTYFLLFFVIYIYLIVNHLVKLKEGLYILIYGLILYGISRYTKNIYYNLNFSELVSLILYFIFFVGISAILNFFLKRIIKLTKL